MPDMQRLAFDWVVHGAQPGLTGAALLAVGLLYGLCGYRLIRVLVVVCVAVLGLLGGLVAVAFSGLPAGIVLPLAAVLGGLAAVKWPVPAIVLTGGATWGLLGGYLGAQFGLSDTTACVLMGVLGVGGAVLTLVSRAPMVVLFTTLQGAALMVLGFVGVANDLLPTLGSTFRALAGRNGTVVPVLLLMVTVTAYSYQASARKGDIMSGSRAGPGI